MPVRFLLGNTLRKTVQKAVLFEDGYRFEILFPEIDLCRLHRKRSTSVRSLACLVLRPVTRLRQLRNDPGCMCRRMSSRTSFSLRPNWNSMASKGVRSSQAISMRRFRSSALSSVFTPEITAGNGIGLKWTPVLHRKPKKTTQKSELKYYQSK